MCEEAKEALEWEEEQVGTEEARSSSLAALDYGGGAREWCLGRDDEFMSNV
jgi:hypothetical protein